MWRQVALPVIVVALSWLTVSGATNFYLYWLDASYQRVFDENIASIHAASLLEREIWRLHAEITAHWDENAKWSERLHDFEREVEQPLATLVDRSSTAEERAVGQRVAELTRQYSQELATASQPEATEPDRGQAPRRDHLLALAAAISDGTDRIRAINDELLKSYDVRRERVSSVVLWARSLAILLVPALGIAIGWWTAVRMQRSVTQIQVTLHDPALAAPGDLGTVQVRGGDELASIRQQVELVVNRLRRTGQELQAARQEVLRAERLAAIGGLAAGVAHELRNPLTSVKLLLQHAATRGRDVTVASARIGLILDEIERMEATIQGLLDFSRPAKPQRKLHDLRHTLARALNLVEGRAEKQGVQTEIQMDADKYLVNGDVQQLHQVFVNLLINAIEAMPDGGTLAVHLLPGDSPDSFRVEILDTGSGIPAELLPRLFEPFASTKERGTGLGLAVSRRVIEEHGGTIGVRARSPQGTVFTITLPRVTVPTSKAEPSGWFAERVL